MQGLLVLLAWCYEQSSLAAWGYDMLYSCATTLGWVKVGCSTEL